MCRCVRCGECNGSGIVWVSFTGEYLGDHRCDDMDEMITCSECNGCGIEDECSSCAELEEYEEDSSNQEVNK